MANLPENHVTFKLQGQKWLHTKVYHFHYIKLPLWDVWGVETGLKRNTFRMESAVLYFFPFYCSAIFHGQISSPTSLAQRCTKTRHRDSASVETTQYTQVGLAHKPNTLLGAVESSFRFQIKKKNQKFIAIDLSVLKAKLSNQQINN